MSDLNLYYTHEISAYEFGLKYKGRKDTKRLLESRIKLPKMLAELITFFGPHIVERWVEPDYENKMNC